ncbi:MAG: class I mannose-6-phosphate isomerase [Verrucomicrobia bacterium]|nr:class I mannose-6-phosphate isomerase [Verrucomicrobiota bacterium]
MTTDLYPLLFNPIYKNYIWGGERIRTKYARQHSLNTCAESWELSDRPEGLSIISNGHLVGVSLSEIVRLRRKDVLGPAFPVGPFPLLIKILDARARLSVQVHPDNATAARFGGEPKTEMWVVLDAEPGSRLYAGLRPGASRETMQEAVAAGTVEQLLQVIPVSAGNAVYIPGGRVHAIGEGCLIFEVQQNSNTTYRLFDWNRVDHDGKARDLHIDKACQVIRWDDQADPRAFPSPLETTPAFTSERLVASPFFRVDRLNLLAHTALTPYHDGCNILFVVSGNVRISAGAQSIVAKPGTTCLLPAACNGGFVEPIGGPAQLLRTLPG